MKFTDIFTTASRNLLRSKLRTSLTIVAIFIGAFTLTLTSGLGAGISSYLDAQIGNIGQNNLLLIGAKSTQVKPNDDGPALYQEGEARTETGRPGGQKALTDEDIKKLQSYPELTNVKPFLMVNTAYARTDDSKKFTLEASTVPADSKFTLLAGQQLGNNDGSAVLLPKSYIKAFGFTNARELVGANVFVAVKDASGKIHEVSATVSGVLEDGLIGSTGAVLTPKLTEKLYKDQTIGLPAAAQSVYVAATGDMKASDNKADVTALKKKLSKDGYTGSTLEDQLGIIQTVISAITWVLNSFALIALLAAGFGIVNTLLMSVQERTKEIGLMKAMGMAPKRIFTLFSLEAILIGFWGSLLGSGAAMGLGVILNNVLSEGILKSLPGLELFGFNIGSFVFVMLLIMGIAFIAGALPARRASRLNPIDALRYE